MKRSKNEPSRTPGTRPSFYVIVVAASEWSKEHYPADRFNLWDALRTGKDPDHAPEPNLEAAPEPDLEAEP
jgi:hypothetical protein